MGLIIDTFDRKFAGLHARSLNLLDIVPEGDLYRRPRELPRTLTLFTAGEYLLRSAASVEQSFGGIMTRLWDDPFEWTLPEKLSSKSLVAEYLTEAERTRQKGFTFLSSDEELARSMPAPSQIKTLFEILADTLTRAEHYQGRAAAVVQFLTDEKLPSL